MQSAVICPSRSEPQTIEDSLDLQKPGPVSNPASKALSPKLEEYSTVPQWKDWQWQMRNRLRNLSALKSIFPSLEPDPGLVAASEKFPLAITPYYAAQIRKLDDSDPIFRMCMPQGKELWNPPFLREDPLEEERDMPVPGVIHRYPDRVLLIATSACAMYCRYCTRKRVTGMRESCVSPSRIKKAVEYLSKHPEIKDVVVSGGDPLTMPTDAIEFILSSIRSVPSVEIIRIGTKTPVTLPFRITDELAAVLRKYHPVWVNTHFNHPCELTPEAVEACAKLADAGIPIGNQTVLLKGVNDTPQIMEELLRGLVRMRVRPYYLFQCDLVAGVEHFRTPLSRGIEIMEYLRGKLSGIAIPTFVVDMPHGGGKVPVLPDYVVSTSPTHTVLRNGNGMMVSYPEPYTEDRIPAELRPLASATRVWDLAKGYVSKIQPESADSQAFRGKADPVHESE